MANMTTRECLMPCKTCPFRSDVEFFLSEETIESVLTALYGDSGFHCHNTTAATGCELGEEKACVGAAIFLEHTRSGGVRANLAFRLREAYFGDFEKESLNMDAPVYKRKADFVAARVDLTVVGN